MCEVRVLIGQTISHYLILEKLGEGGMGVVYKAQDTRLDRFVALKFLPDQVSASSAELQRFVQEAKAAAALNHPNICTIYGIEEAGGKNFIVMEFVEGQTLQAKKSSLAMKQTLDIGIQIADGLAAAHDKGIVHRDIKPDNIMIRRDGIVQIMDFGLAKLRGTSRLTKVGSTLGTAGYMSPEQLQSDDVDHRSDIFSLGVVLFELITKHSPFSADHHAALAYEIINVDPPPPSSLDDGVSPELDRIILECLQKDPADRFQSSSEVAKELRRVKRSIDPRPTKKTPELTPAKPGQPSSPESPKTKTHRRTVQTATVVSVIFLIGIAILVWRVGESATSMPPPIVRFVLDLPQGSSLDMQKDGLALSPDGKHLAMIVRTDSGSNLFVRDMDQFKVRPVRSIAGLDVSGLFFSPDGQWLGFFANGKLMKLSLQGGTPVAICDAARGQASWGDGNKIVFMQQWGSHLWIVSSEAGSVARPLTRIHSEAGERAQLLPSLLPGGKEALFSIWTGGALQDMMIAVVDLKTGDYHTILKGGSSAVYLRSGQIAFVRGSTLMVAPFDLRQLKVTGEAIPVVENVLTNGLDAHSFFSVSDDGTLAYAQGHVEFPPTQVTLVENGTKNIPIDVAGTDFGLPMFSPDGNKLAVEIYGPTLQVGIYDLRRNTLTPLTFSADNIGAAWLPDGSHIGFISNLDNRYKLYTIAADGSQKPQKLFDQAVTPPPPPHGFSWSPDAMHLAYVTFNKETVSDIYLFSKGDSLSGRPLIATKANEFNPSFSPDGRWIAYVSDESGQNEVYVQPFPTTGGRWRISTNGGDAPVWTHDGHRILFKRGDEILFVPLTISHSKQGVAIIAGREQRFLEHTGLLSFELSPDGKSYIIGETNTKGTVDHINVVLNWSRELQEKSTASTK